MEAGKAISVLLNSNFDLGKLVGEKIYPLVMDQTRVYPAIIYRIADSPVLTKDESGLFDSELQIKIYSEVYSMAKTIQKLVHQTLNNYEGTVQGVIIHQLVLDEIPDEDFEDENELFAISLQFKIIYQNEN